MSDAPVGRKARAFISEPEPDVSARIGNIVGL
jgi:hypothetical protein